MSKFDLREYAFLIKIIIKAFEELEMTYTDWENVKAYVDSVVQPKLTVKGD